MLTRIVGKISLGVIIRQETSNRAADLQPSTEQAVAEEQVANTRHRFSQSVRNQDSADDQPLVNRLQSSIGCHQTARGLLSRHANMAAYPVFAAGIASCTTLFAKCAIELVKASVNGYPAFTHVETYMLLAAVPVFGVTQIYFLNIGMQRFDQLLVIPLFVITLELFNIIGGGIFFQGMPTLALRYGGMDWR